MNSPAVQKSPRAPSHALCAHQPNRRQSPGLDQEGQQVNLLGAGPAIQAPCRSVQTSRRVVGFASSRQRSPVGFGISVELKGPWRGRDELLWPRRAVRRR